MSHHCKRIQNKNWTPPSRIILSASSEEEDEPRDERSESGSEEDEYAPHKSDEEWKEEAIHSGKVCVLNLGIYENNFILCITISNIVKHVAINF